MDKRSSTDHQELSLMKEIFIIKKFNKTCKRESNFTKKRMNVFFDNPIGNTPKALLLNKFDYIFPITKGHINECLAKKFIANLSNLINFDTLKENYLNKVDLKPVSDYIKDYLTEDLKEILYKIVLLSKSTDSLSLASSNAITILNKAEFVFTNKDLSMIKIPNADLSYGIFYNTNFSSSNLYRVNFSMAHIYDSNFKDCNMTEVNFGEKVFDLKSSTEIFEFSRCGRFLAVVINKIIWLYSLGKNQEIAQLEGHNEQITFLSFSDNGKYLASWSSDSVTILWDTYNKLRLKAISCRRFVNFSPCGTYLSFALCSPQWNISIYDINLDKVINKIRCENLIPRFTLFSHTGTSLIALYNDCWTMIKWNLLNNNSEERLKCQHIQACFAISSCRKYIAVPYTYCQIKIYDVDKFEFAAKLYIMPRSSYLAFSPCGRFLASGSEDRNIEVFDLSSSKGNIYRIFNKKNLRIKPFAFSADGTYLFVGATDPKLKSWEIYPNIEINAKKNMRRAITNISFSFDSQYFAVSNEEGWVFIFFVKNQKLFKEFKAHNYSITCVSWSGNIMATSGADYLIKIWDIYSSSPLKIIQTNENITKYFEISPDGKKILSCDRLNLIIIFDIERSQIINHWKANRRQVHMWTWSQCGKFVITCSADGSISIWKADNQELITEFIKHYHEISLISLSTCGKFLISYSLDKNIKIWYLGNADKNFEGACIIKDFYVENLISSIKWSHDGAKCFEGNSEGKIVVWDKCTGKFTNINAHSDAVTSIDSSRCGDFIVTGSNDRTVKLWKLDIK